MNPAPAPLPGSHPVLTCAEAAAWERRVLGGDEAREWSAMTEAGSALARAVGEAFEEIGAMGPAPRLLVLCGKGHNGGDALLALHALLDARPGARALVLVVPGFEALRPLARRALERLWRTHGGRIDCRAVSGGPAGSGAAAVAASLGRASFDVCLDGLFGLQFAPPLRAPADWLVAAINAHPAIRLRVAVDLPSGLGDASDPGAFRADLACATGIAKAPLFAPANRSLVGRVRCLDLGFFDGPERPASDMGVLTRAVLDPLRQPRSATADKRCFGHLFVVSGSRSMPGAVFMAVQAALLSGVGLVTAFVPESVAGAFAARLPEAMWVPMPETPGGGLALEGRGLVVSRALRCTGLLAGPGLGTEAETAALAGELLAAIDVPAVLDADALRPDIVNRRGGPGAGLVLTPHAGEFERMSGGRAPELGSLRAVAAALGAAVVLKGAPAWVSAGGCAYASVFGGPVLARGGSGDVLAGLVAGQLAAGAAPLEAAARGVVWHGCAAERMARGRGETSARATGLADHLGAVLREEAVRRG